MDRFIPLEIKPLLHQVRSDCLDVKSLEDRGITEWKGHYNQQFFPAEYVKYTYKDWEPRTDDILIASFMKTGTTITREIIRLLLYSDIPDELEISQDLAVPLVYLEAGGENKYKIMDSLPLSRRYFTTHLPPQVLNMEKFNEKDIKDQYVSFHNHMRKCPYKVKKINGMEISANDEDFFQETLKGEHGVGLLAGEWYFEYLNKWSEVMKENKNIIQVVYEDLIRHPAREIKKIAEHINVPLDDAKLNMIMAKTSIDHMKSSKESAGYDKEIRDIFELVRKGGFGGWKNKLTVAQSEAIDEAVLTRMKCDIKFTYE